MLFFYILSVAKNKSLCIILPVDWFKYQHESKLIYFLNNNIEGIS
jgi:hypothetical protein